MTPSLSFGTLRQILLLGVLVGIALFFSLYKLTESPPVWYDEGFYIQSASNLAFEGGTGLRIAPDYISPSSAFITVGYPLIYPLAFWFTIFGQSVLSARLLMVLFIAGLLCVFFLFSRRLWGTWVALAVLALLVTFPPLYGNGKSVLGEVPGLFYTGLFLLLFHTALSVGEQTRARRGWIIFAGLSAGLAVVTKPLFLLLLPALGVGVLLSLHRRHLSFRDVVSFSSFLLGPLLLWFHIQFRDADSLATILSYYANPSVVDNVYRVIVQNFLTLFQTSGTLYLVLMLAVWVGAFLLRLLRREYIRAGEVIAFSFALLVSLAYLRTAGWFRYLFPAQILCLVFFPHSMSVIAKYFLKNFSQRTRLWGLSSVIVLLVFLGGYQTLFHSWVADAYNNHRTSFWETYFAGIEKDTSFFFYDTPEVAIFEKQGAYYQYIAPAGTIIGKKELDVIREGRVDVIIAETATYKSETSGLFDLYGVEEMYDKYSILVPHSALK